MARRENEVRNAPLAQIRLAPVPGDYGCIELATSGFRQADDLLSAVHPDGGKPC